MNQKGSVNIVLIVIIVLLLGLGGYFVFLKKFNDNCTQVMTPAKNLKTGEIKGFPTPCSIPGGWEAINPISDNKQLESVNNWEIYSNELPVYYNTAWLVSPIMYQSAGEQAQGKPIIPSGLVFTLPSGADITWGGPQSACNLSEFSEFIYGVSKLTCVSGLRASLDARNVDAGYSKESGQKDKNSFGDFVLKNI